MLLSEILNCECGEFEISGISQNSKTVKKNDAYFCLCDDKVKAAIYCREALANGATCVVCGKLNLKMDRLIETKDVRSAFANACANFYGRPCDDLKIVGVTGTNGKTTTCHVIAQILSKNGKKVGVIGTNGVFYDGKVLPCPLTTPDADFLHQTFRQMKESGVEYVVMEVSAHAIDQKRVDGIKFEVGVLTNITQDHLDYFNTLENYKNCKFSFFTKEHIKQAVVCNDDEMIRELKTDVPVTTYALNNPSDVFAIDVLCSTNGSSFVANVCDHVLDVRTNLIGQFNVYNTLAAMTVCQKLGLNDEEIGLGLNFIKPVEGRFNVFNFKDRHIVVDFAHSPDGLVNVLQTARLLTDRRVIVVFGCGGCRDKDKRPKMGKIAEELADVVCLTDDNPRLEKSLDIIAEIEKGMTKAHFVEPNRTKAIEKMVKFAQEGDVIVIAGKGAEKYQEIGKTKIPYSDFDVIKKIINDEEGRKICQ